MKGITLNTGRTHFKKGHIPWNKETKGVMKAWNKGMLVGLKGEDNPRWLGGRKEHRKRWLEKHREHKYYLNHRRLMLKREVEGSHSQEEWLDLCKTYNYMCLCCKRTDIKLTEDHIVPLSMGGTDYIWNIQPLCRSCNSRKQTKTIDYRGGLWIN